MRVAPEGSISWRNSPIGTLFITTLASETRARYAKPFHGSSLGRPGVVDPGGWPTVAAVAGGLVLSLDLFTSRLIRETVGNNRTCG
jgi:hypothetical protein